MLPNFRPSPTLNDNQIQLSLRLLVWEGVASGAMFSLGSGGFMAAYALALGANNLQVGILASLPFVSQILGLPAILLVERYRVRKIIGLPALVASHLIWLPIGAVPFVIETPGALAITVVIVLLAVRGLFAPLWVTTWTSWVRDLVPQQDMGRYYSGRMGRITGSVAVLGLGASFFVNWWVGSADSGQEIFAYSYLLIGGALVFGLASPLLASHAVEPLMPPSVQSDRSAISILLEPLQDRNFSQLLKFLFAWGFISNLAIPFFAVYMLTAIGLSLPVVIGLTVVSQISNVLFVRVWGRMVDNLGSKTVLSLSASLYLMVIIGWVFTTYPDRYFLTIPLLVLLHAFAGIAAAGVTLTVSTLALKIAPEGKSTSFAGLAGIATYLGAGIGPILGGLFADYFSVRELSLNVNWTSPNGLLELPAVSLTGFEFLFVIAFLLGLFSLNLLVALREEGEMPRDIALSELMAGVSPMARAVSSVPGLSVVSNFSYKYLKRVPGADVAIGVTAYQLAASTQAAAASAGRGRMFVGEVARHVGHALGNAVDEMEDFRSHGLELAQHATRGAVHSQDLITGQVGRVARGAVLGTLRTLINRRVTSDQALRGVGYGAVEGAVEAGHDPAEVALATVEAAREAATELGISEEEAVAAVAESALEAARAGGEEALSAVLDVLPAELLPEEQTLTADEADGEGQG